MKIGKDYLVGNNVNYSRINEVEQSLLVEKFPQFINTLKIIISKSGLFNKPYNEKEYQLPIFIFGCGRSGTTFLFDLLAQHPLIARTTGYPDGEDHKGG